VKKIGITEPHKFKIGGGNWGETCNFVKIQFLENITRERATEIAYKIMSHITKD